MRRGLTVLRLFFILSLVVGSVLSTFFFVPGCSREGHTRESSTDVGSSSAVEAAEGGATPHGAAVPVEEPIHMANPGRLPPAPEAMEMATDDPPTRTTSEDILAGIPPAPMGRDIRPSALLNSPGYFPPADPEADAVRRGRRDTARVDRDLSGGASSPELLALAILDALRDSDRKALQALRVTRGEFAEILWPEFPASRPIANMDVDGAWFWVEGNCVGGIGALLGEFGDRDLRLVDLEYEKGVQRYTNFNLVLGIRIVALDENEKEIRIKNADSFVERDGTWKVFTYKD